MKHMLIIDGHDTFERAPGNLTKDMAYHMSETLSGDFSIETTVVADGYNKPEEIAKFLRANIIIVQMPIYWFSVPGILKKYMDDIFDPGIFFQKAEEFGRGGLLTDKQYMLSVTWGAPEHAFEASSASFLEGKSVEDVLFPVHKTFEYCGLTGLPTFSVFSAMKNPDVNNALEKLNEHLSHYLNTSTQDGGVISDATFK